MANIFKLDDRDKVAVFIDGISLYNGARLYDARVDYKMLLDLLHHRSPSDGLPQNYIIDIHYYNFSIQNNEGVSVMRGLLDWLGYNGVAVCARDKQSDTYGGHFCVDISVDVFNLINTVDHFIFIAHDPHFLPLFQELRRRGKKVTLLCAHKVDQEPVASTPSILRQSVHQFIELGSIIKFIEAKNSDNGK